MNKNIVSSVVENLFWFLPFIMIFMLWEFVYPVFIMLIISCIGYIVLSPLTSRLERIIRIRILSILIVLAGVITPIYFGISYLTNIATEQYDSIYTLLIDEDSGAVDINEISNRIETKITPIIPNSLNDTVSEFFNDLRSEEKRNYISSIIPDYLNVQNTIYLFSQVTTVLMFILITITFIIMLLLNAQSFKKSFIKMVPNRYFEMSLKIIDRIAYQISSYVRGTLTAAFIVGGLSIIGLNTLCSISGIQHDYIIVVGIVAGLFNLIPFIGPMIGAFAAVLLFLLSGQPEGFILQYYHIFFILFTFGAVQLIDNLISSPLIISDSVGLHPMFVIIVVLIGGSAMGVLGMLISVPFAAILKVITEELIWGFRNYRYL